jgi:hypothetical protein
MNQNNPFYKFLTAEDKEHVRFVEHLERLHKDILWFHIPNEGKKTAFERYKHSIMGAKKGASDFVFLHPKYNEAGETLFHGLIIELKAPEYKRIALKGKKAGSVVKVKKGELSEEQVIFLRRSNEKRYKATCCFGCEESIEVLKQYLK